MKFIVIKKYRACKKEKSGDNVLECMDLVRDSVRTTQKHTKRTITQINITLLTPFIHPYLI